MSFQAPIPCARVRRNASVQMAAFTVVEIILAIGLATALLLIAMTFYHQSTALRSSLLKEAERVSTLRLVLDRLAGDLRGALPMGGDGNDFRGDSTSMSFTKLALDPLSCADPLSTNSTADLVRITLTTVFGTNENQVVIKGLDRQEAPVGLPSPVVSVTATNSEIPEDLSLIPTNQVEPQDLFAEILRFVRFRYWSGTNWQNGWTNTSPPPGVEILVSTTDYQEDPFSEEFEVEYYPPDPFRRVVALPGGLVTLAAAPTVSTNSTPP